MRVAVLFLVVLIYFFTTKHLVWAENSLELVEDRPEKEEIGPEKDEDGPEKEDILEKEEDGPEKDDVLEKEDDGPEKEEYESEKEEDEPEKEEDEPEKEEDEPEKEENGQEQGEYAPEKGEIENNKQEVYHQKENQKEKEEPIKKEDNYSFHKFSGPVSGEAKKVIVPTFNPFTRKSTNSIDFVGKPDYSFGYGVHDSRSKNSHTRSESRNGNTLHGEYRVLQPDGFVRIVKYSAHPTTGFQAHVSYTKL